MLTERHGIDELYHLSGQPIPSSIGRVPNSDNEGTRSFVDFHFTSNLPVTLGPVVGIDYAPTSEITSTETHRIAPSNSVRASTAIPAVPTGRQLQVGSASSSAPLMPVSAHYDSPNFQGAQNVYLHHPTITVVNNHIQLASNANANDSEQSARMDDTTEKAKARDRARVTPLKVIRTDRVGYEKEMTTKATLYDGKVIVETRTSCRDAFHGLRGRVLIVLRDVNGDVIRVTDKMCCTTRGGILDFRTPSSGDDTFSLEFPQEVTSLTVSLDIWQADDVPEDAGNLAAWAVIWIGKLWE